jgi:ABC-type multidrug transport system fused ATPase/permease subunit
MKAKVDATDNNEEEKLKAFIEEDGKKNNFMRLMQYNKPAIFILTGCITSLISGGI